MASPSHPLELPYKGCLHALLTGYGDEKHAVYRIGVRAERRNVRYVCMYVCVTIVRNEFSG